MKIIYDLAENGLAKLNLPLELNFPCIVLCQIIMVLWFSMYHVHENVVVVGIDLSGFSMYYLFKKIRFVVGIENVVVVVCTQQAAGKRNPPALPALPNGNGETTPTRGFSP